jgi:NAD(P)H dehydrogenase (quinone)
MNHEQMAAELSEALGRRIVFDDIPIEQYCKSLESMGVPPYIVQHLGGAMEAYQQGVMGGMNDNVEKFTGQKPMSVAEFARAHVKQLNPS